MFQKFSICIMRYDQLCAISLKIIYEEAINDLIKVIYMGIDFLDSKQKLFRLKTF